jgi:hypothetical protein
MLGGLVGSAITSGTVATTVNISQSLVDREQFDRNGGKMEARRAFYSEEENPGNASVFVIYIDAAINGKRVFVRTMAPATSTEGYFPSRAIAAQGCPIDPDAAPEGQFPFVLAVNGAIQYWLEQYSK